MTGTNWCLCLSVSPSLPSSLSKINKLKKNFFKPHLVKSPFYSGLIIPLPLAAGPSHEATKGTSFWRHVLERHVIHKYEKCINVISKTMEMVPYTVFAILLYTALELGITVCWSRESLPLPPPLPLYWLHSISLFQLLQHLQSQMRSLYGDFFLHVLFHISLDTSS